MKTDIVTYWKESVNTQGNDNSPERYLTFKDRSLFLDDVFKEFVFKSDSILELGCNSGRNLIHLQELGYKNLSGVDINPNAIEMCPKYLKLFCEPIETFVEKMDNYNVIFTMATFQHLPEASSFIFPIIAQKTEMLITVEDELSVGDYHIGRNYQDVFERLGMKQIKLYEEVKGQTKDFKGRVFKHG